MRSDRALLAACVAMSAGWIVAAPTATALPVDNCARAEKNYDEFRACVRDEDTVQAKSLKYIDSTHVDVTVAYRCKPGGNNDKVLHVVVTARNSYLISDSKKITCDSSKRDITFRQEAAGGSLEDNDKAVDCTAGIYEKNETKLVTESKSRFEISR